MCLWGPTQVAAVVSSGKSQPLRALILNQGSVGGLLSKGPQKIVRKILSTGKLPTFLRRRSALPLKIFSGSPHQNNIKNHSL